ncbi:SCO family protein [Oceanisphaera sp. W20_SRM_FM3]|uniref:SCO family protein n=1 Tax=Oceanisphaera sp. W20_SRM_FM3 TaxID=3240267 RepID=UPI003F978D70
MRFIIASAVMLGLMTGPLYAHENHGVPHIAGQSKGAEIKPVEVRAPQDARSYFTDTALLNQHGETVRFYSDVLQDKVVLLNVIFTHCDDACPLITRKLKEVREAMDEKTAEKVHFISITSDPLNDKPEVLQAFIRKHEIASPNWTFLTGDKADVDLVLARLGHFIASPEAHSTLLIAGDVANKRWNKIQPDAAVPAIAQRLQLLTEPRL